MKQTFFITIIMFLLFSCEDAYLSPESETDFQYSNKDWNETAFDVALDISKKMNSLSFRKMLKHEVMLQFDGDYNILISSMIQRLPKYLEYEENQVQVLNPTNQDLLSNFDWDVLESAAEDYPMMQIAVQVDAENWDPINDVISVVYLTSDYDEKTHDFVEGFDNEQNPISVSTLHDPTDAYVVVSHNERTYELNNNIYFSNTRILVPCCIESAPYDPNNPPQDYFDEELCRDCSDAPTPPDDSDDDSTSNYTQYIGTGHNGTLPSLILTFDGVSTNDTTELITTDIDPIGTINGQTFYRANYQYERVRALRFDNLGQVEGWPAGKPELRVHVMEQDQENPFNQLLIYREQFRPERSEVNETWWEIPEEDQPTMHLWDWENTGTRMTYGFYEYDRPFLGNSTSFEDVGDLTTQLLNVTEIINDTTLTALIGDAISFVGRGLEMENNSSEYIGTDDISIFNDLDEFPHNMGGFKYRTWPDLP